MKTLKQTIKDARQNGVAVGHFNISNLEGFHAIVNASKKLNLPVIVGVSEGERDFVGVKEVVALVKVAREQMGVNVFLNADHTYSVGRVKEAIDAGFDAVIYDGAKISMEENITNAKECVAYAQKVSAETGREILVEAEIGYIGMSSKVLDAVPEGVALDIGSLSTAEDSKNYVQATGVNLLAPAIGSFHGMVTGYTKAAINAGRVQEISDALKAFADQSGTDEANLVLHGGSGNTDETVQAAIKAGIAIVHVNTELRVAFKKGVEESFAENTGEVAPYKSMKKAQEYMQEVIERKLKVFNMIA